MSLKTRLQENKPLYGLFCSTPAALSVELIAAAGYDFVLIDLEHTLIGPEQLAAMLLAARAGNIAALVRVAAPHQVAQALDAGAEGIVFPRIRSPQDAQQAVRLCHFSPVGERGLNSTWHSRYGRDDLAAAMHAANARTLVVAMIEELDGLAQAAAIAAIDGIDVLLEGAADLSQALGLPWQTRHPQVMAALARIRQAAQAGGKVFCALPRSPEDFDAAYQDRVRMFILGDDRGIARRAMAAHLSQHQVKDL
ncbi:HpcH/HpaI aldolase family protein [Paraherbaspirillum soli]|uniref:HpcH/HpaI aldolase/citrate lyase family protein n=1 Tax=Paraherbaspirillum soli TaxID=631222 RepID=A0ABW0MAC9_9BURK